MMPFTFQRFATKSAPILHRQVGRRLLTTPTTFPIPSLAKLGGYRLAKLGAGAGTLFGAQYLFGQKDNFFEYKFSTKKKAEDIADFYGSEDFMEIFCVLPFMVQLMMRGAVFDDDGTCHAWGLLGPGELEVSIDFDEKQIDTTGDGEPDTLAWFNKKEHFRDVAPSFLGGFTLWEMTQNFGYHLLDDGTCEIYHHGEKFNGLFPLRFLLEMHARYVIWATEQYVNSDAFGAEDRESDLEEQRQNIPLHVFKEFLDSLVRDIEKAKDDSKGDSEKQAEFHETLRRLKTVSSSMDRHPATIPRLRTLRSRKTAKVEQVDLVFDDKEAKNTIHAAMQQIGSRNGHRHAPATEMSQLARRATLVSKSKGATGEPQ